MEVLSTSIKKHDNCISEYTDNLNTIQKRIQLYKEKTIQFKNMYDSIPIFYKKLRFIGPIKKKLKNKITQFCTSEELGLLSDGTDITNILNYYTAKILNYMDEELKIQEKINTCKHYKNELEQKLSSLYQSQSDYINNYSSAIVLNPQIDTSTLAKDFFSLGIQQLNDKLDKDIRYLEFWLAVHYYECIWSENKFYQEPEDLNRTFETNLEKMFRRISLFSPCIVTTFFTLPNCLKTYLQEKKSSYMYNFIDLLIVDEAGQVSPEIGAPSFALAKKAVVVGDELQIEPIWNTQRGLDVSLAISHKLISSPKDYDLLSSYGHSCSSSNLMRLARNSCNYVTPDFGRGLLLVEHRRCYNSIINYCNELVYNGLLLPMRGDSDIILYPYMAYYDIKTSKSQSKNSSRYNTPEAEAIINWIGTNFPVIKNFYHSGNEKQLLGIVTPFKEQKKALTRILKQRYPELVEFITIGTVHEFQGGERNIIIFSTVYGATENCNFIDNNKNFLNVAVSRAKDSFLIFGSRDCLKTGTTASGLLRRHTETPLKQLK